MTLNSATLLTLGIALVACGSPPPPLVVVAHEAVRVEPANEEQDEWLHEHCVYSGTAVVGNEMTAIAEAVNRHANYVEPLLRDTSSSSTTNNGVTTSSSSSSHHVVFFACSGPQPW